jgi:hypothetical protein
VKALAAIATGATAAELQEVASFPNQQVTGVGVSIKSGRIFLNFPNWSDEHTISLAQLVNGAPVPFPNLTKNIEPVIADKRLLWPDTLSWGPHRELYVTASQIENMPRFNNGVSTRTEPYKLWKITGSNQVTGRFFRQFL